MNYLVSLALIPLGLVVAGVVAGTLGVRSTLMLGGIISALAIFIPLLDDPHRVGKPLDPPMAPAWTGRRGTYRILYLIDDDHRTVEITAVRHRADAYGT